MENEGTMIVPVIGYVLGILIPILGLIFGAALVFLKKETPLYQKHGRFIIYLSIVAFIIYFILNMTVFSA